MTKRTQSWQIDLVKYLTTVGRTPFAEGSHDCALFLAGGVHAMTGEDYAADYRGQYQTTVQGLRLLRAAGYADHVALAKHHLNEKPVAFAQIGDGAVVEDAGQMALGIVQGASIYVLRQTGLALVPLGSAICALEV